MNSLTVAICTYNRAELLLGLIRAIRRQECPIPFEILIVDNNSTDETPIILERLRLEDGVPLRIVKETKQGIVHARNRALAESSGSAFLAFLDDDELPLPGMLIAAVDALDREGAECVGGRIKVHFGPRKRPSWLGDDLLGFLGEIDYGDEPFWISTKATPIWSGNVAYRTSLFREHLQFDHRYNRKGKGIGGGEDEMMFHRLLSIGTRIRYRPAMVVNNYIEEWRLKRNYFLKLHFKAGLKFGQYATGEYPRTILGVPPFMFSSAIKKLAMAARMLSRNNPGHLREFMNFTHALGMTWGRFLLWRNAIIKR